MNSDLIIARELFNRAHKYEEDYNKLLAFVQNSDTPVLMAYKAAMLMMSGKYIKNPFKVMGLFNQGKSLLEDLISENFDNAELHYIRYTIQLNAPRLAGYYKSIEKDRELLADYIRNNKQSDLSKHMFVFVEDTNDGLLECYN